MECLNLPEAERFVKGVALDGHVFEVYTSIRMPGDERTDPPVYEVWTEENIPTSFGSCRVRIEPFPRWKPDQLNARLYGINAAAYNYEMLEDMKETITNEVANYFNVFPNSLELTFQTAGFNGVEHIYCVDFKHPVIRNFERDVLRAGNLVDQD